MSLMQSKSAVIESYLREGSQLRLATIDLRDEILRASDAISKAFRSHGKLLTFGNGGSAADAQHIAAEFSGRFRKDREPLPALALMDNASVVTAIGNDMGFDEIWPEVGTVRDASAVRKLTPA